jgi:hypothetical protein
MWVKTTISNRDRLNFMVKSLFDLSWQCLFGADWVLDNGTNCENATDHRPQSSLADVTTVLVDDTSGQWVAKDVRKMAE